MVDISTMVGGYVTIHTRFMIKGQVAGHDTICALATAFQLKTYLRIKRSFSQLLKDSNVVIDVSKVVTDRLREEGVSLESIAIVWSHNHFDHVRDSFVFPSSTALIVGPGFKSNKTTFPGALMSVGVFPAIGYSGDGGFLMYSEGHTREHMWALAHISEDEYIFLGGDVAHHAGEFRPTVHVPLPGEFHPSPLDSDAFDPQRPPLSTSHDVHLQGIMSSFPQKLNDWGSAGFKSLGRWRFLKDFLNGVEE
ncbi:hypothetical protein BDW72DRAFT_201098 [Aspergillus terricola var. indicus]